MEKDAAFHEKCTARVRNVCATTSDKNAVSPVALQANAASKGAVFMGVFAYRHAVCGLMHAHSAVFLRAQKAHDATAEDVVSLGSAQAGEKDSVFLFC